MPAPATGPGTPTPCSDTGANLIDDAGALIGPSGALIGPSRAPIRSFLARWALYGRWLAGRRQPRELRRSWFSPCCRGRTALGSGDIVSNTARRNGESPRILRNSRRKSATACRVGEEPNRVRVTPKHGSWLNLVEGFFSKLARSVLRDIRVASKQELKDRIMIAMDEFNRNPVVHTWSYKLDQAARYD